MPTFPQHGAEWIMTDYHLWVNLFFNFYLLKILFNLLLAATISYECDYVPVADYNFFGCPFLLQFSRTQRGLTGWIPAERTLCPPLILY